MSNPKKVKLSACTLSDEVKSEIASEIEDNKDLLGFDEGTVEYLTDRADHLNTCDIHSLKKYGVASEDTGDTREREKLLELGEDYEEGDTREREKLLELGEDYEETQHAYVGKGEDLRWDEKEGVWSELLDETKRIVNNKCKTGNQWNAWLKVCSSDKFRQKYGDVIDSVVKEEEIDARNMNEVCSVIKERYSDISKPYGKKKATDLKRLASRFPDVFNELYAEKSKESREKEKFGKTHRNWNRDDWVDICLKLGIFNSRQDCIDQWNLHVGRHIGKDKEAEDAGRDWLGKVALRWETNAGKPVRAGKATIDRLIREKYIFPPEVEDWNIKKRLKWARDNSSTLAAKQWMRYIAEPAYDMGEYRKKLSSNYKDYLPACIPKGEVEYTDKKGNERTFRPSESKITKGMAGLLQDGIIKPTEYYWALINYYCRKTGITKLDEFEKNLNDNKVQEEIWGDTARYRQ